MKMTRDEILEKLQLMHELADQEDLKTSLDVAINAIYVVEKISTLGLDPQKSDAVLGAEIRLAILSCLLGIGGTPDET